MMSINDFAVVLSGGDESLRHTAALVINQALHDRGFSTIDVLDAHGEPIVLPDYVPSVLEIIRRDAPSFLKTFVTIQEVKIRTYDDTFEKETPPYAME